MDWSYIAGYFDGEGHVENGTYRGKPARRLSWTNTHRASIEAIRAFMGVGQVRMRRLVNDRWRPAYTLTLVRREHLLRVLDLMIPHLIVKRAQAEALRAATAAGDAAKSAGLGRVAAMSTDQLREWYEERHESVALIAWRLGVGQPAVSRMLRRRGISCRQSAATRAMQAAGRKLASLRRPA